MLARAHLTCAAADAARAARARHQLLPPGTLREPPRPRSPARFCPRTLQMTDGPAKSMPTLRTKSLPVKPFPYLVPPKSQPVPNGSCQLPLPAILHDPGIHIATRFATDVSSVGSGDFYEDADYVYLPVPDDQPLGACPACGLCAPPLYKTRTRYDLLGPKVRTLRFSRMDLKGIPSSSRACKEDGIPLPV